MIDTSGLEIVAVTKDYRNGVRANDEVSLNIRPGEIFGLLGPNGAGKTTLVRQIVGLLAPTSGSIRFAGADLVEQPQRARQICSYLPQGALPVDSIKMRTAIELIGRLRGGGRRQARAAAEQLIEALELGEWAQLPGRRLSGGVQRLMGFAMATVVPAPLIILDEPTNDVDPLRRRLLWAHIRHLAEAGHAVLLVTHNVLEAERSVDRVAIMHRARVQRSGSPASLASGDGRLSLQLILEPDQPEPEPPDWLERIARDGRRLVFKVAEEQAADALRWGQSLYQEGAAEAYELGPCSLEETYIRIVAEEGGASCRA